ncbi:MAG: thiamine-phosphate kinase [Bacteroidota bacterium]|jgi:thiamine-monophosphate kinase
MQQKTTPISQIGEFGLINQITSTFEIKNKNVIKGIGDDCAVIDNGTENYTLISTDILAEGIHFDLMYTPLTHLGYKAVAVNVSDVCAMNGKAEYITVSLSISSKYSVEAIEELYSGIQMACEKYNVELIGGDTTSSLKGMFISITVIGSVSKEKIAYRSGAKPKELICCSGDLGAAYMGLQLLEREKQVYLSHPGVSPDLENQKYLLGRELRAEARVDIIEILNKHQIIPTSMIDISDGLSSEIHHLCKNSNCGATIFEEKIPIHSDTYEMAVKMNIDPITTTMNGGEDYELLFTITQSDYEKIKDENDISIIGFITDDANIVNLITKGNNSVTIEPKGWKAFASTEQQ